MNVLHSAKMFLSESTANGFPYFVSRFFKRWHTQIPCPVSGDDANGSVERNGHPLT
jgi:hypothetical protein